AALAAPTTVCTIHGPAIPATGGQGTTDIILDARANIDSSHPGAILSWRLNNSNGNHTYSIFRWTAANTIKSSIAISLNQSYEDANAERGQTYFYQVVSVDPDSAVTLSSNVIEVNIP
ncbi:MAG: hypothetical protein ACYCX4_13990, partial [Bacillota bacterium]